MLPSYADPGSPDFAPMERRQARALGLKEYASPYRCLKCSSHWRRTYTGACLSCQERQQSRRAALIQRGRREVLDKARAQVLRELAAEQRRQQAKAGRERLKAERQAAKEAREKARRAAKAKATREANAKARQEALEAAQAQAAGVALAEQREAVSGPARALDVAPRDGLPVSAIAADDRATVGLDLPPWD